MTTAITKIALRATLLATVIALVLVVSLLVTKPAGITFAQGLLNLTIDSEATYNGAPVPTSSWDLKDNLVPGVDKFFNFNDIKPGDSGENTISFHVNENAWICLNFTNLTQAENGMNEPEALVDNTPGGDLATGTQVFAWRDDGDNIFEPQAGETKLFGVGSVAALLASTTYAIADALNTPFIPANTTRYFGLSWCAGTLAVNMTTGSMTCSGAALGNIAQTDSFSVDVSIFAAVVSEQPQFTCNGTSTPPTSQGLGEQTGLFVKCQVIAQFGWPLPKFATECPGGFGNNPTTTTPTSTIPSGSRTPRTPR